MKTLNGLRDEWGIDTYWTQNTIGPEVLQPKKMGKQWFFDADEVCVARALWATRPFVTDRKLLRIMAEGVRALFAKDSRRTGRLYIGRAEASWAALEPSIHVRLT